jgi:hypothetical protein
VTRAAALASLLIATAIAGALVANATAQERPADTMDFMRARVQEDKKAFISNNLELTEAEARAFWPVYDRFQSEIAKLQERALRVIGDYVTAYPNLSDDMARRLLDDSLAVEADWVKVRQAFVEQFRRALPDRKVARYYQLENKIHALVSYELAAAIPIVK